MIKQNKCIVIDIDGTLCSIKQPGQSYAEVEPNRPLLERLRQYHSAGWHIILCTSRSMRTYDGNIGLILANTAPVLMNWLKHYDIPYHEIHFGKPWPGGDGFYVDDRAIRPSEFVRMTLDEIHEVLKNEQPTPAA